MITQEQISYQFDEFQTESILAKYPEQVRTLKAIIPLLEEEGLKSITSSNVIYDSDSYDIDFPDWCSKNYIESASWKVEFNEGQIGTLYLVTAISGTLKFWFHLPLNNEDSPESDYWDLATLLPEYSNYLLNHHQIVLNWLPE